MGRDNCKSEQFRKQEYKLINDCIPCCGHNGNMLFEIEVIDEAGNVLQSAKVQRRSRIRFTDGDITFSVGQQGDTVLVMSS